MTENGTKRCSGCGPQPVGAFHKNHSATDGLQSFCKPCQAGKSKASRQKRRASVLASSLGDCLRSTYNKAIPLADLADEVLPDAAILLAQEKTAPAAPPATPLETAYAKRAEERNKRDLKKEHSALLEENEQLRKNVEELVRMQRPPDVLIYQKKESERSDATACAIASDWHCDEPVRKEDVHGLNEYSPEIARERAERFFRNLLRLTDIAARDSKITTIFLSMLGDFISGHIHEELLASTAMAPGDAAHFVKGLFFAGINFLLKESSYNIEADCIPGNHGRMTDQVWSSDPTGTSLETFMYHAIADKYADNPRVKFRVADKAMLYRKFYEKYVVREIHGYEINYGGGVGGITIPINKAIANWNYPIVADLTLMGHFHKFMDMGDAFVNGSMIGYGAYSQRIKAKFEPPRQSFCLISARGGGEKSLVAPIWLDEKKADGA